MKQARSDQRPSILYHKKRASFSDDKPKKRTSFSEEVYYSEQRRVSGVSIVPSEGTTDDSHKSNEFDSGFMLRTSTLYSRAFKRIDSVVSRESSANSTISRVRCNPKYNCFSVKEAHVKRMKGVLDHICWKSLIFCFTLILIFGGSLHDFFPIAADPYFEVLFLVTFIILIADVWMMSYAVPNYFVFRPTMKRKTDEEEGCFCFAFQMGSFFFWVDLISILSLLFEISFINKSRNEIRLTVLHVNQFGVPESLWRATNSFHFNSELVVNVIIRIARMTRILQVNVSNCQSVISNLSSWIRNHNRLDPRWRKNRISMGSISAEHRQERIDAACIIQRAWRSQNTADAAYNVGAAFFNALATRRAREEKKTGAAAAVTALTQSTRSHTKAALSQSTRSRRNEQKVDGKKSRIMKTRFKGLLRKQHDVGNSIVSKKDKRKKKKKSQIGSAMNEFTMRRVAMGLMIAILLTTIFTYQEYDQTPDLTIVSIHNTMALLENENGTLEDYGHDLVDLIHVARNSSIPSLCSYTFTGHSEKIEYSFCESEDIQRIRKREMRIIKVCSPENANNLDDSCSGSVSSGLVTFEGTAKRISIISLIFTFFILFLWTIGLLFFVGPVTTLVVSPIERMIRLLSMLVKDPLGYTKSKKYKTFLQEKNDLAKNTMWTHENLTGMETSFLMSTILRIGSLMKVGYGSAGVEIIRGNLRKSASTRISLTGDSKRFGSTVSCIFMFCDIRGFTDSSECLNEEVFVFTNRIAAVVHSYCHAYGGSANKNIGDAFLLSWKLDPPPEHHKNVFYAGKKQADKALLSVVKICIALYHESYFLEGLSAASISALKKKFAKRPGNLVQLGFGLHAGKAVEGAIGSQRKLDATYLSEAVELSEYLESSTKKYGVNVLMSGKFYSLLQKNVKEQCRKIDHVFFTREYEEDDPSAELNMIDENSNEYHMSLHTYDMNIDALFENNATTMASNKLPTDEIAQDESVRSRQGSIGHYGEDRRSVGGKLSGSFLSRRRSLFTSTESHFKSEEEPSFNPPKTTNKGETRKLEIPEGTLIYTPSIWHFEELRTIRRRFTPLFYERFKAGYVAYISSDWKTAQSIFELLVEEFQDKPSQHLLDKMKECKYKPPRNFSWRLDWVSMEYH